MFDLFVFVLCVPGFQGAVQVLIFFSQEVRHRRFFNVRKGEFKVAVRWAGGSLPDKLAVFSESILAVFPRIGRLGKGWDSTLCLPCGQGWGGGSVSLLSIGQYSCLARARFPGWTV